nr:zinc finger protein RFP-like [Pelodiscus sinensis]|eukprot:XP_006114664.1 zinc finger protein RFP-like [Pelodiscus sinensis]
MAAAEPLQSIKAEVTCPICLELFRDRVMTECGHSFCRECITRHCQGDGDVACPQCQQKLQERHLRPNRELKNIVELVKSQAVEDPRGGYVCKMHREPLRFYCKEDETPVCMACERSRAHRAHTVVPVEKAVQEHKVDVKSLVRRFEEWLSPAPSQVSAGEQASVSPAGQGVTQTESRGHTGEPGPCAVGRCHGAGFGAWLCYGNGASPGE